MQFGEAEYRQHLVKRLLQMIQAEFQPSTWKACWENVVAGRPGSRRCQGIGDFGECSAPRQVTGTQAHASRAGRAYGLMSPCAHRVRRQETFRKKLTGFRSVRIVPNGAEHNDNHFARWGAQCRKSFPALTSTNWRNLRSGRRALERRSKSSNICPSAAGAPKPWPRW